MLHARVLDIATRLEKRAKLMGADGLTLDLQAVNAIRDMVNEAASRRSMIDQTVRGIRNGMVEVKPEELKVLAGAANQLREAIIIARSVYTGENVNVARFTDLAAAVVAAEFLLSHTLFTIEERQKV